MAEAGIATWESRDYSVEPDLSFETRQLYCIARKRCSGLVKGLPEKTERKAAWIWCALCHPSYWTTSWFSQIVSFAASPRTAYKYMHCLIWLLQDLPLCMIISGIIIFYQLTLVYCQWCNATLAIHAEYKRCHRARIYMPYEHEHEKACIPPCPCHAVPEYWVLLTWIPRSWRIRRTGLNEQWQGNSDNLSQQNIRKTESKNQLDVILSDMGRTERACDLLQKLGFRNCIISTRWKHLSDIPL